MKKPKKLLALLLAVVILAGMLPMSALATEDPANTGSPAPVVSVSPDVTEAPAPTETVAPTEAPAPSETVAPTEAPAPSETVTPTEAPAPTETVAPTEAPAPSETVTPTETPAPSETVAPTETPAPTLDELRAELREMLVQMTQDFFSGDFTKESWEEFQAKLAQGWALLTRGYETNANEAPATEAELQSAIATLSLAPNALMPLATLEVPENPVFSKYNVKNAGDTIDADKWFLIVNEDNDKYYALRKDGKHTEVALSSDKQSVTFKDSQVTTSDYLWRFTSAGDGKYYIQNVDDQWLGRSSDVTSFRHVHIYNTQTSMDVSTSNFAISDEGFFDTYYLDYKNYGSKRNPDYRYGFDSNEVENFLYWAHSADPVYSCNPDSVDVVLKEEDTTDSIQKTAEAVIKATVGVTQTIGTTEATLSWTDLTVDVSDVAATAGCYTAKIFYQEAFVATVTVNVTEEGELPWADPDPDYPEQGAVRIDKSAGLTNFDSDGVARIELDVTGVPKSDPVDAVLVIDLSNSMDYCIAHGIKNHSNCTPSRLDVALDAAEDFVDTMLAANADGTPTQNRVAIVWYGTNDWNEHTQANIGVDFTNNATTLKNWLNDPVGAENLGENNRGTNYDAGMAATLYLMQQSAKDYPDKERAVLFMSDGAPTGGYNGVKSNDWLDPNISYDDIEDSHQNQDHSLSAAVKGYATLYTVGFGIAGDDRFSYDECEQILKNWMASKDEDGNYLFWDVDAAGDLTGVFNQIATSVLSAGTDAYVEDVIDADFELYWKAVSGQASTVEYGYYDLYTYGQWVNEGSPEDKYDQIGTRLTGDNHYHVLERITLGETRDGTKTATSVVYTNGVAGTSRTLSVDENGSFKGTYISYDGSVKTETGNGQFTWTLDDITDAEKVLTYNAYLIGSKSGNGGWDSERPEPEEGEHYTNEHATLYYKNYQGQDWEKEFNRPVVVWQGAMVRFEFFLANEQGKPIDPATSNEVPFIERQRIYVDYKSIRKNAETIVDGSIEIRAADLPAGYQLLEENASYTVRPFETGSDAYELVGEYTVLVTPTPAEVTSSTPFLYSEVAFPVVCTMTQSDKTVVVDFGKSIVSVGEADMAAVLGGNVIGFTTSKPETLNSPVWVAPSAGSYQSQLAGQYGTFSVNEKGEAVYTPTRIMNGVETTVYFLVESVQREATGTAGDLLRECYLWAKLTVIPATNVYYEDTLFSGRNLESDANGGQIDQIKEQDPYTQGGTYGYDSHYSGITTDNSTMTVVNGEDPGTFTFTFKGTGVDIYSRTETDSDMILAQLYSGSSATGTPVKQQLMDAQYKSGTLYNVPTISFADLDYDTYTVKVTIPASNLTHRTFYIDGVRVYNPVMQNQTAVDAYKADGEDAPFYVEVRDILLEAGSLDKDGSSDTAGAVYVDTKEDETSITTYEEIGPKNETYLKRGNAIGFKIDFGTETLKGHNIYIGAKSANGDSVKLVVNGVTVEPTISTTTDMYYDITSCISTDGIVVIENGNGSGNGILSLTKLRITGMSNGAIPGIYTDAGVLETLGVEVEEEPSTWVDIWNTLKDTWFKWLF